MVMGGGMGGMILCPTTRTMTRVEEAAADKTRTYRARELTVSLTRVEV
jgi:hypothetical protein